MLYCTQAVIRVVYRSFVVVDRSSSIKRRINALFTETQPDHSRNALLLCAAVRHTVVDVIVAVVVCEKLAPVTDHSDQQSFKSNAIQAGDCWRWSIVRASS